jgi:hypothetical protein
MQGAGANQKGNYSRDDCSPHPKEGPDRDHADEASEDEKDLATCQHGAWLVLAGLGGSFVVPLVITMRRP